MNKTFSPKDKASASRAPAPVVEAGGLRHGRPAEAQRICVMVLGMHRSGTSALTRVISLLGAELPKEMLGANPTNPTGHWEPQRLIDLHDRMLAEAGSRWDDWRPFDLADLARPRAQFYRAEIARIIEEEFGTASLFVLKEPRMGRFVPLYAGIFEAMGVEVRYVHTCRNPLAVIGSLEKRDRFTAGFTSLLWLRHELEAEHATRHARRVFVSYEDFLRDWRKVLAQIDDALEIAWSPTAEEAAPEIDAYLSTDHQHHVASEARLKADGRIGRWVKDGYAALRALGSNADDSQAQLVLERIKAEFDGVSPVFGDAFYDELSRRQSQLADAERHWRETAEARANELARAAAETSAQAANAAALIEKARQEQEELQRLLAEKERLVMEAAARTAELDGQAQHWQAEERQRLAELDQLRIELEAQRLLVAAKEAEIEASAARLDMVEAGARDSTQRLEAELKQVRFALETRSQEVTEATALAKAAAAEKSALEAEFVKTRQDVEVALTSQQAVSSKLESRMKEQRAAFASLEKRLAEAVAKAEALEAARDQQFAQLALQFSHGTRLGLPGEHGAGQAEALDDAAEPWQVPAGEDGFGALLNLTQEQTASKDTALRQLIEARGHYYRLSHEFRSMESEQQRLLSDNLKLSSGLQDAVNSIAAIRDSTSWRVSAPVRAIRTAQLKVSGLADRLSRSRRQQGSWWNVAKAVRRRVAAVGVTEAARQGLALMQPRHSRIDENLAAVRADISERLLLSNLRASALHGPRLSVLMPVYRTPLQYLERAILSVMAQSYQNWELCITDDGSGDAAISDLLQRYASIDQRLRIVSSRENEGIAGASNRALDIVSGDFVALLDHDDVLTKDALLCVAETVQNNPQADILYSDECKVDQNDVPLDIFQKPNWSPHLLLNCMYIGHLTVYRRRLVVELGGFRSAFDFSQDYDLALRATERTDRIVHIERVLYGWRTAEGSAAAGGKDYARQSNIAALDEAIARRGYGGKAVALPFANQVSRDSAIGQPLVSIIIPSDNAENIAASLSSISGNTSYSNYELIVVTNSRISSELRSGLPEVLFVEYDKPFNFSDKCNQGAAAAKGDFLLFFNDDVRTIGADWLAPLLEIATLPNVGIVGPKLLYENNTIQHAGMVTGVRGLVGTAFHGLPDMTTQHYNFAQSVRDVSLICGACLMIPRSLYAEVGGFDAENFPISHSDVDLCLKVRKVGRDCVYTPYSRLYHIGHASIGASEASAPKRERPKDKADIRLLQHWGLEVASDPFWTASMRAALYHDSQEDFQLFPGVRGQTTDSGRDVLIVSHDLSQSGAPRVVLEIAKALAAAGDFVVVASPTDGPVRHDLTGNGITVIVDELLLRQHDSVARFVRNFDAVIVNTIVCWPLVQQICKQVPVYWYLHESNFATSLLESNQPVRQALRDAADVWVGSAIAGKAIAGHIDSFTVIPYGVASIAKSADTPQATHNVANPVRIAVFGSHEPRKGQDLAVLAMDELANDLRRSCELVLAGRVLDTSFHQHVMQMVQQSPGTLVLPELTLDKYRTELEKAQIVLVPSRDDTLPLVSIDALAAGKILICAETVGTSAYIENGVSGFTCADPSPPQLAACIARAVRTMDRWPEIGDEARLVFEKNFSASAFAAAVLDRLSMQPAAR